MANPTDKFDPAVPGSGGSTGGLPQTNYAAGTFNFTDGQGRVLRSVELDANGQAIYSKTITAADRGFQKIGARYTGDTTYRAGSTDEFTYNVADVNGNIKPTVDQIVAGPGIFISSPNGTGIVTISTAPINTRPGLDDLYSISWTPIVGPSPYGIEGQFTAVGNLGTTWRSRDGHNWVQLENADNVSIAYSVSGWCNTSIGDGNVEYFAVSQNNTVVPGAGGTYKTPWVLSGTLGLYNDGMISTSTFNDQHGVLGSGYSVTVGGNTFGLFESANNTYAFAYGTDDVETEGVSYITNGSIGGIWNGKITATTHRETSRDLAIDWNQIAQGNNSSSTYTLMATGQPFVIQSTGNIIYSQTGKVYRSIRGGAGNGSWSEVVTTPRIPYGIAHGGGTTYTDGIWITVGARGMVLRSTDNGSNWSLVASPMPAATWLSAAYGNGQFVAVGKYRTRQGDRGCVMFSTDMGLTWRKGNPGTTRALNSVAYSSEKNVFVAVGDGGSIVSVDA